MPLFSNGNIIYFGGTSNMITGKAFVCYCKRELIMAQAIDGEEGPFV